MFYSLDISIVETPFQFAALIVDVDAEAAASLCCLSFSSNLVNSARAISSSWSSTWTTPFTSSIYTGFSSGILQHE